MSTSSEFSNIEESKLARESSNFRQNESIEYPEILTKQKEFKYCNRDFKQLKVIRLRIMLK